ncbi:unnamed protein product, partial [Rotaria sordida]
MNDRQPLLNTSNKLSIGDDDTNNGKKYNEFIIVHSFSDWRRCFNRKDSENKYIELDDDTEHNDKDKPVGVFRLFRFANRIDFLLMFIAMSLMLVQTACILVNQILVGRLTGLFAILSFGDDCDHEQQNFTAPIKTNNRYSHGINLNIFNNALSHNPLILSSTLPTSMSSFREQVMKIICWLFIVGTIEYLADFIKNFIWSISMKRQIYRMSVSLFQSLVQRVSQIHFHLQKGAPKNIPYMDSKHTGQFNVKLFDNIAKIDKGIGLELLVLMAMILCIIVCFTASLAVNWQLTLTMLCLVPLIIGSSFVFSKVSAKETMNELMTYAKAGQIVQEVFSSLRTVLSLNGSKFEQKRYAKELPPTRWSSIRQGAMFGVFTGVLTLITYLVYSVGFFFGSLFMSDRAHHSSDISDILVVVFIFTDCLSLFSFIGPFFQSFAEARGAAAAVFRLIDEGNDPSINEADVWKDDTESIYNINGDIQFDNVDFIYPSRKEAPVLHNLSLIARAGQTTALVGLSGCGKSTCMTLFLRYYEPSSGQITIDGRPITDYNVKQLRENIGVVSQEPILFDMNIYENIRFGKLNATQEEIEQAAREANAHHFIMQLPDKYKTLVGERGVQLSGGEKQRIALARALIKHPTFLLLDEATSALDNVSEKIVQEALDRACHG